MSTDTCIRSNMCWTGLEDDDNDDASGTLSDSTGLVNSDATRRIHNIEEITLVLLLWTFLLWIVATAISRRRKREWTVSLQAAKEGAAMDAIFSFREIAFDGLLVGRDNRVVRNIRQCVCWSWSIQLAAASSVCFVMKE